MWRRVEIRNFRSIESVDVELAPLTVLVGRNGSGKSNFADALVFVRDLGMDASTSVSKRGGILGVRRWSRTKPFDVSITVRAAAQKSTLDSIFIEHSFTIASGRDGKWEFKRERIHGAGERPGTSKSAAVKFLLARTGNKITESRPTFPVGELPSTTSAMLLGRQIWPPRITEPLRGVRRYRLNPDEMRTPQKISERSLLEESGANIGMAVRKLREQKRLDEVLVPMAKIIPGLEDIEAVEAGRFLSLMFHQRLGVGDVAQFSATEISDGALRALGIIVAARQMQRNELLIIEEPEVNIHVGAAGLLFDILKQASQKGAVLITTHSADLLDAARDEEILVCQYRDGITLVGPLASEQRAVVREGLFSVAELMRSEDLRIEGEIPASSDPSSLP